MISVLSTNITSPLGFTTEQNYQAVRSGRSAIKRYEPKDGESQGLWGLPEPFAASLFSEEQNAALAISGYTRFESLAIRSVCEALSHIQLDVSSPRVVLILSTTKGGQSEESIVHSSESIVQGSSPSEAAQRIAEALGVTTTPIVVCNACVSGLSAQLLANYLLTAGLYDYAIVVGADVQSKFIVSGFQSLKAVSAEPCRPFDIERNGLNLGEAAATIVYTAPSPDPSAPLQTSLPSVGQSPPQSLRCQRAIARGGRLPHLLSNLPSSSAEGLSAAGLPSSSGEGLGEGAWCLLNGTACNDAFHIVSPSPQADGCYRAIETVMAGRDKSKLATVGVHGTATLYNDQMESVAIARAGLADVPLTALKGYYGHTMGAAGVLETILTMRATDDGIVLPSKGFTELGVSKVVSISNEPRQTDKAAFLKLMSGFGGCNVAVLYEKAPSEGIAASPIISQRLIKSHAVQLSSEDGTSLAEIYRQRIGDYPKFYKMDILSRLTFVAAELLSQSLMEGEDTPPLMGSRVGALILFNHSSSIVADRQFLSTISEDNFFPSPSTFVYTLPNIAAGEVAIRHHLTGETSFYILPEKDEALMQQIIEASLRASGTQRAVCGWVDAASETSYECELAVYEMLE